MLPDISKANIEVLHDELFIQKQVTLSVLRLDRIHPVVSGNKFFKLHYFLEEALVSKRDTILTFGGAYSNHLAATACACKVLKLKSIAVVRGEKPAIFSHTLNECIENGMLLKFVSRQQFSEKDNADFIDDLKKEFGNCLIIPEGGYAPAGAKGAALIIDLIQYNSYTHICTASGTATTTAGLLLAAKPEQIVVSLPVLKGMTDNKTRIKELTENTSDLKNLLILDDYHFGGYAKKTDELISFMNDCWIKYKLPLDFVYTGKMLYGIIDSIKKDRFDKGSKILCVHTGGLQGNKSLPLNSLLF
jgi:1-aminocyclopropane-1-carboxylate deaminase